MVATLEDGGNLDSSEIRRAGVLRVFQKPVLEALRGRGPGVPEDTWEKARNRVDDTQCNQFPPGEHEVPEGHLRIDERPDPLVYTLVAATDEDELRGTSGQGPGHGLVEGRSPRGGQQHTRGRKTKAGRLDCGHQRFRLENHARAAPVGRIIRDAVFSFGVRPNVVGLDAHEPTLARLPEDALGEVAGHHLGKQCQDVDVPGFHGASGG
jgi:hypothetical protein